MVPIAFVAGRIDRFDRHVSGDTKAETGCIARTSAGKCDHKPNIEQWIRVLVALLIVIIEKDHPLEELLFVVIQRRYTEDFSYSQTHHHSHLLAKVATYYHAPFNGPTSR